MVGRETRQCSAWPRWSLPVLHAAIPWLLNYIFPLFLSRHLAQSAKTPDDGRDKLVLTAKRIVIDLVRVVEGATINEVRKRRGRRAAYLGEPLPNLSRPHTRPLTLLLHPQVLKKDLTPEHEAQYKALVRARESVRVQAQEMPAACIFACCLLW